MNISWKDKVSNIQLYGTLPSVSSKVAYRRMKLAGHCVRHPEEIASKLVLWQPVAGRRNVGRQSVSFIETLYRDTNLDNINDLKTAMLDRDDWKKRAEHLRVKARPK